jgi:hypothetical protein
MKTILRLAMLFGIIGAAAPLGELASAQAQAQSPQAAKSFSQLIGDGY